MLKIRYYKVRLPKLPSITHITARARDLGSGSGIALLESSASNLVLRYTIIKQIESIQILDDGSEFTTQIPTIERQSARFFQSDRSLVLSLLDPSRSTRITSELLDKLFSGTEYFIEPLEISANMIQAHIKCFDSAKLVSAKIRDFRVYENAIGRLEISSKEGLPEELAPFLAGKYYKVDSLTYEVTHMYKRGLICYSNNGSIRVSGPLVDVAFPTFEQQL